jgi:tetratricopeptide (TPR) repeat protein
MHIPCMGSESLILTQENLIGFADKLFSEGKFDEAVVEYQRLLYFFPDSEERYSILMKIARCYKYSESYDKAAKTLSEIITGCFDKEIADKAIFELGDTHYLYGEYEGASAEFKKVIERTNDVEQEKKAGFMLTFSYLRSDEPQKAYETTLKLNDLRSKFPDDMDKLVQGVNGYLDLKQKSPVISGLLSAVLPGSGHFYISRFRDGILALILNGLFTTCAIEFFDKDQIAPGVLFTVIESSIYSGTIFSSVSQTHKYNRFIRTEYIDKLETKIGYHGYSDFINN